MTNSKKDNDLTTENIIYLLNEISQQPEKVSKIIRLLLNDKDPDVKRRLAEFWTIILLKHGDQIGKISDSYDSEIKSLREEVLIEANKHINLLSKIDYLKEHVEILSEENIKLQKKLKQRREEIEKEIEDEIRKKYEDKISFNNLQIEKLLKSRWD